MIIECLNRDCVYCSSHDICTAPFRETMECGEYRQPPEMGEDDESEADMD